MEGNVMNPISNQAFSYDYEKFIYQKDFVPHVVVQGPPPNKPFKIVSPDKSEKSKKDIKKEKKGGETRPYDMMSEP